jgi:hypothetical protein
MKKKLILSSSFRGDYINISQGYDFSHTLLCYLSQTYIQQTHLNFVEQKLMLSSSFRCGQIHNNNCREFGRTLLCNLCRTWKFEKSASEAFNIQVGLKCHVSKLGFEV